LFSKLRQIKKDPAVTAAAGVWLQVS